MGIDC